jgi:UDP-N-acetylglucosamine 2-epimerase (non-hydrolysing)
MSASSRPPGPLVCIVGARPNYMKMAPLVRAFAARPELPPVVLVHTGQHYDVEMNERLFADLELPPPDLNLEVGSGTHAVQTAEIMRRFDPVAEELAPSCVIVVGDVNSTLACSLVATKRGIPVVHVEAGLRSRDRTMPEEINRILTDQIADLLYTTERAAADNLVREGVSPDRIRFVGNVMIDSLLRHRLRAVPPAVTLERAGLGAEALGGTRGFGAVTLHRPSNVDTLGPLRESLMMLADISKRLPLVWPMHPRAKASIERFGLSSLLADAQISVLPPQGYLEMLGPARARAAGPHRLRRHPGGDDGAGRALPDDARQYRAAADGRAGDQYAGRTRSRAGAGLRGRHSAHRRQAWPHAGILGWPRCRAHRRRYRPLARRRLGGRGRGARMTPSGAAVEPIVNALSIDVEDYFMVSAFAPHVPRNSWDSLPCRVEANIDNILALLAERDVHATFFTLGWVAERYPALVRRIVDAGHELASHGYEHYRATEQGYGPFLADIRLAKAVLEDVAGQPVSGYRAPSFSVGPANDWAFDCIALAGYRYSSSIYPIRHDHYGAPKAPRFAYEVRQGLLGGADCHGPHAPRQLAGRRRRLLPAVAVLGVALVAATRQRRRPRAGDVLFPPVGTGSRPAAGQGSGTEGTLPPLPEPEAHGAAPAASGVRFPLGSRGPGVPAWRCLMESAAAEVTRAARASDRVVVRPFATGRCVPLGSVRSDVR